MSGILKSLAASAVKIGTQAVNAATAGLDRMANRQEFEAVVAATVLVASADGTVGKDEKTAAMRAAQAHPALKNFSAEAVMEAFTGDVTLLGMDRELGIETLLGKVKKVTDLAARTRLIGVATEIANADGVFDDAEKAMVERLRTGL